MLPPLLFHGGWVTDWTLLRRNVRPIALLSVALVVVSTVAVARTIEPIAPGFGWASAFVLGAIVSPPDAVAAGAIFERFSVPRRISAILDGEGLLNDGTALVIYRFAVIAAVLGRFSLPRASLAFVEVVAIGDCLRRAVRAGGGRTAAAAAAPRTRRLADRRADRR